VTSLGKFKIKFSSGNGTLAIDKEKIFGMAQKYILGGNPKKAIKEYIKLLETAPKDKRLHLKLGDLYLKNGENQEAIQEYLQVADLYAEEDLNFRAISIYKRVLSIDPHLADAFHKIAQLYLKEGLSGSAKGCYQSILKIKPGDQEALKALERIEDQKPQNELAKIIAPSEFRVSNQPVPEEITEASMEGRTAEKTEERTEEKTKERRVPKSGPTPLSSPALPHPQGPESQTPSHPESPESPTSPALLYDEGEVLPPPDKDSEMHYHLGIAYKEMELFDYAISEFELACTNSSMKFDCCIMLGDCFMQKGDYDKSIEYYKTASGIKGLPSARLARLYFNLGVAYEASGMIPEAINAFSQVLKLDQGFKEAQKRIEKLQAEKS
jgi:tetratricopeptide (TPR) repeat protein